MSKESDVREYWVGKRKGWEEGFYQALHLFVNEIRPEAEKDIVQKVKMRIAKRSIQYLSLRNIVNATKISWDEMQTLIHEYIKEEVDKFIKKQKTIL
ncbi:hypothetical protein JQN58_01495 [Aneurinibacillus sp. BA2021]|nr:hypothetical protein [Aneurinibacillus sp. BA2021]